MKKKKEALKQADNNQLASSDQIKLHKNLAIGYAQAMRGEGTSSDELKKKLKTGKSKVSFTEYSPTSELANNPDRVAKALADAIFIHKQRINIFLKFTSITRSLFIKKKTTILKTLNYRIYNHLLFSHKILSVILIELFSFTNNYRELMV